MLFSDGLFCLACRLSTVRVTAADFSGAFNPIHECIFSALQFQNLFNQIWDVHYWTWME